MFFVISCTLDFCNHTFITPLLSKLKEVACDKAETNTPQTGSNTIDRNYTQLDFTIRHKGYLNRTSIINARMVE